MVPVVLRSLLAVFLVQALFVIAPAATTGVLDISDLPELSSYLATWRDNTSSSLHRRDAGISPVPITSDGNSYFTVIQAGNISFRVALDTASSDLWLLSTDCSSGECPSVPKFPLSYHSPSFGVVNNNETLFNISFADGSASRGFLATEAIQWQNFTVPQQAFGLVGETNVTFENQISGVLGMGFPRLSVLSGLSANASPFVNNLAQQGQLDYPLFGLSLARNDSGSLTLGAIDGGVVGNVTDIEWHRVVSFSPFGAETNTSRYLQWAIQMTSIYINGSLVEPQPTYPVQTDNASLALFDVGTNGIFGPYQDVSRIFEELSESRLVDQQLGLWALPCDTTEVIAFSFGGFNFTLQPTDYLIGPTEGNPGLCLSWPQAVASVGDGIDWQFGTPFLRTVYSIFSFGINGKEPPTIGLYPLSNVTTIAQNITEVSSFFSSASATIGTTLPNFPLITETLQAPSYIFNTSVPASAGQIVSTDLGTSTYSAILTGTPFNVTALPVITASPTLLTLVVTDAAGSIFTTTSQAPATSIALGRPPGSSAAVTVRPTIHIVHIAATLALALLLRLVV